MKLSSTRRLLVIASLTLVVTECSVNEDQDTKDDTGDIAKITLEPSENSDNKAANCGNDISFMEKGKSNTELDIHRQNVGNNEGNDDNVPHNPLHFAGRTCDDNNSDNVLEVYKSESSDEDSGDYISFENDDEEKEKEKSDKYGNDGINEDNNGSKTTDHVDENELAGLHWNIMAEFIAHSIEPLGPYMHYVATHFIVVIVTMLFLYIL